MSHLVTMTGPPCANLKANSQRRHTGIQLRYYGIQLLPPRPLGSFAAPGGLRRPFGRGSINGRFVAVDERFVWIRMDSVSDRFRSSAASDEVTDSGGQLVMDSYLYVFVIICHQGFRSFEALGVSQRSKRRREDDEVDHVLLLALCVSLCMLLRGWSLSDKHN